MVLPLFKVIGPLREGMGLCVEDPLVQRNHVVGTKQQVQILQGLCEEEALHCIVMVR